MVGNWGFVVVVSHLVPGPEQPYCSLFDREWCSALEDCVCDADDLVHDCNVDDFEGLSGVKQALLEGLEVRVAFRRDESAHVDHLSNVAPPAMDGAPSVAGAALAVPWSDAEKRSGGLRGQRSELRHAGKQRRRSDLADARNGSEQRSAAGQVGAGGDAPGDQRVDPGDTTREIGERFVGHPPRRAIVNLRQLDFQRAGEIDQLPTQTHQPRQPVPGFARGPCAPLKYPF